MIFVRWWRIRNLLKLIKKVTNSSTPQDNKKQWVRKWNRWKRGCKLDQMKDLTLWRNNFRKGKKVIWPIASKPMELMVSNLKKSFKISNVKCKTLADKKMIRIYLKIRRNIFRLKARIHRCRVWKCLGMDRLCQIEIIART